MKPEDLVAWADKIDRRLGPLSGHDADALAALLRNAADALSGVKHPTGHVLNNLVEVSPRKASGVPVIVNTRFTVAQLLAELANGRSVANICRSFGLDKNTISSLLHALALQMDKPIA